MNFIPEPSTTVGNIQGITIENIWFENNKNFAIQFETSNGNIENVSIDKCRFAITDNGAFNFVNTSTTGITTGMYNLIFGSGNHIIGNGTITIPSYVSGRSEILTGGQLFAFVPFARDPYADLDFVSTSSALQLAVAIAMTLNSINEFIIRMALTRRWIRKR
jgi:hypothetical protein